MDKIKAYLKKIDQVIEQGSYKDQWASLSKVGEPEWYKNAKFGIFIHWGVYSVPAYGNEWYPRIMYNKTSDYYQHHVATYGDVKDYPYAKFIEDFKAEQYDPAAWADLFKEAGAKFVMPVAEHHDGFQMYNSDLSEWNAVKMGPHRDVMGDLKTEIEERDMMFAASSHRAENFWFFNGATDLDSGLAEEGVYQEPYGYRIKVDGTIGNPRPREDYGDLVPKAHLEDWLVRTCELVDKYQPKVVWFDWWIQNGAFKPYLRKFAAYYYNRGIEWGIGVSINYKNDAYVKGTAIFDVERGQLPDINPRFWQTDTAIAKNSWGYTENNDFKTPESIVCDMLDIVSKNGAMLLNVGPKADGSITEEDTRVLKGIGQWLKANGEAVYDTTYWQVFGEGPTEIVEGTFQDVKREAYTTEDIRYTYKAPYIYAHVLKWPENNQVTLKRMCEKGKWFEGILDKVELLAYDNEVTYTRDEEGLKLSVEGTIETTYPVTFKMTIN